MTEGVKIKCDDCKFVENCVDYGWDGCRKFTPTPNEPMTNEEWLSLLSTKEKAKFICNLMKGDDLYLGVMSARDMIKDELNHGKDGSFVIYEWLKEIHNG